MPWVVAGVVVVAAAVAFAVVATAGSSDGQQSDVAGQGGSDPLLAENGATLMRARDGLRFEVRVPTPDPGSYEYPTADQVAAWSPLQDHPVVSVGADGEPEVFTIWLVAFNHPDQCTDGECGGDDFSAGAAAAGGIYQGDGRVADGPELEMTGSIRLGQEPLTGAPLENPLGAEVHLLVAPHGRALTGPEHWMQLNSPLGNPSLWWAATFSPE